MPSLPGRCVNTANCSAAASGVLVRAPASGRYVCPHCGKTLVPPTTKLRRGTRGRQMLRDMGESSGAILGVSGLIGGVLLGGLLLNRAPVVGLSRYRLQPPEIVNVTMLSQPGPLAVSAAGGRHRRHSESAGGAINGASVARRVVLKGQRTVDSGRAL